MLSVTFAAPVSLVSSLPGSPTAADVRETMADLSGRLRNSDQLRNPGQLRRPRSR
jgi:hypothetical protein